MTKFAAYLFSTLMISIEDVIRIALQAHEGQKDLDGKPEILHPLAVGLAGTNREEIIAGFLHDVVEDSSITFSDLREKGVDDSIINSLALLTHDKSKLTYTEYINRIATSGNRTAIHVKYNDLRNNLRRGIAGHHMKQVKKHEAALKIIEPLIKNQNT